MFLLDTFWHLNRGTIDLTLTAWSSGLQDVCWEINHVTDHISHQVLCGELYRELTACAQYDTMACKYGPCLAQ